MSRLLAFCVLWLTVIPGWTETTPSTPSSGETAIQENLAEWEPKWYDSEEHTWRRVAVKKAPEPETTERQSTGPSGSWMPADAVGWILVILVCTLVAIALVLAIRSWLSMQAAPYLQSPQNTGSATKAPAQLQYLPFQVDIAADPSAELEKALANGEWNKAIIWSYVKLLLTLEEHGLLHLRPGATDRGCLQQVQTNVKALQRPVGIVTILKNIILLFQRSYFGHQDASEQMARQATQGLEELQQLLTARTKTTKTKQVTA